MSQNEQVGYQDPILTPGNLRKIVQNLPSKAKVNTKKNEQEKKINTNYPIIIKRINTQNMNMIVIQIRLKMK